MIGKIKRRSLRCGGRPKADFGSIFTSVIAPALNVAGSIADSAIAKHQVNKVATTPAANTQIPEPKSNPEPKVDATGNNGTTVLPPDPTKTPAMRLGGRKKCWIGAAIGAATSIAGSLFGNSAQKREMRRQQSIRDWQDATQEAANMTSVFNNSRDYQEDYLRQFRTAARLGKTLGAKGIYITDGGDATKIGNNTYLLRGGSHEDVNETGQTGIGINVDGNEVEAEGGEVAQKKNGALRIFSAQPILSNDMSPAQAIMRGYNKDKVFNAQQQFKRRNGLKDDGSKAAFGDFVTGTWNFLKQYRSPITNLATLAAAYQKFYPNSNYNKQKGKFGGGKGFNGSGAGGSWTNVKSATRKFNNFNDAYDDAVNRGASTFKFGNKLYNTKAEGNSIREINNRVVGSYRDTIMTNSRGKNYGVNFGPIKGPATLIPLIYDTYDRPRKIHRLGGGLTSKDRGSSKHPYPSVSSKDFAGGGRSYPIPTKADAVDALRLAGLHGRNDVRSRVYSRYPELRKKAKIGIWIKPVYNTSKYHGTSKARKQIAKWEGSDFAKQNAQFKGDAIGAKEKELRKFMGKAYNYLNDNQRDALLSYYYNLVPKTFRSQMTKYRNDLINAQTEQEYNDTLNNMRESINVGANRKGMRGLRNRRAIERNWFGYNYTNPIQKKVDKTLTQVPDATKVVQPIIQQPAIIKPIEINPQEGYVPNDNPQGYNIPQGRLYDFIKGSMKRQLRYGGSSRPVKGIRPKAELGWLGYPYPLPRKWDFTNINLGNYKPSVLSKNYPYARGMDDKARQLESSDNYRDFTLYRTQFDETNPYVQALTKATGHSWNDIKDNNYKLRYDNKLGYNHFTPEVKEDKYGIWGEPVEQKTWLDNNKLDAKVPYAPNETIDTNKSIPVNTKKTTEYDIRDNKFGMTPSTGDWIGLGVDTLAGLAGSIINYNAAKDVYIPGRAPIMLTSKLPTNYNIAPQLEEVKRYRDRLIGETYANTSSSVAALNRAGNINLNSLNELSKLWTTKENEENKMLTQDALNQQSVAETNIRNQMARESEIAKYKNAQNQAKYDAINTSLTGLAQAYNNFYTNATKRYEDEIAMRTYLAGSEAATPYRMLSMGVPMSTRSRIGLLNQVGSITNPGPRPERKDYDSNASWSRAIDKWEKDNTLYKQRGQYKNMILRGISSKAKRKYGIG